MQDGGRLLTNDEMWTREIHTAMGDIDLATEAIRRLVKAPAGSWQQHLQLMDLARERRLRAETRLRDAMAAQKRGDSYLLWKLSR